jgi:hypothetical protein
MELQLDESQAALLQEVLDRAYRDLRFEIGDTDSRDYKRELMEREQALRAILDRVGGPLPDADR